MASSITIPDVCARCGKLVQRTPHRPGDYPNRPVHTATGREDC